MAIESSSRKWFWNINGIFMHYRIECMTQFLMLLSAFLCSNYEKKRSEISLSLFIQSKFLSLHQLMQRSLYIFRIIIMHLHSIPSPCAGSIWSSPYSLECFTRRGIVVVLLYEMRDNIQDWILIALSDIMWLREVYYNQWTQFHNDINRMCGESQIIFPLHCGWTYVTFM